MALFTCSYSAYRPPMGTPVRITLGSPRRPEPTGRDHWLFVAELAPKPSYFHDPPALFAEKYQAQLDRLAQDIDDKLSWLSDHFCGPIVLLCYERRVGPDDCHRRRFAGWYEQRWGVTVAELDPK